MSADEMGKYAKLHSAEEAEAFLRMNAQIIMVGTRDAIAETSLGHLSANKNYLLAIMEVE